MLSGRTARSITRLSITTNSGIKTTVNRWVKSCEYIPKKVRRYIKLMDNDKVSVAEILRVLRRRKKKKFAG
ncbi:MAG: hypothetical protein AAFN00_10050 [Cyanobacteria bacterium J06558_2]